MSRTRVLVTGATGFVGRQVVKALSAENMQLRLLVRNGKENFYQSLGKDVEVIPTKDLFSESISWWAMHCTKVDVIIHLAWHAEPGEYLTSPKNLDCLIGSLNMVKGAVSAGVKRIVGIGTCFEYDLSKGELSIETPIKPMTLYAATKAALYMTFESLPAAHPLEFAWCRLFYLYGEGEDSRRLVAYLHSKIKKGEKVELTSGEQIRDYLDVKDAGQMIVNVALSNQTGPINICSGVGITVRKIAEKIADQYGKSNLLQFGARAENIIDPPCVVGIPNLVERIS